MPFLTFSSEKSRMSDTYCTAPFRMSTGLRPDMPSSVMWWKASTYMECRYSVTASSRVTANQSSRLFCSTSGVTQRGSTISSSRRTPWASNRLTAYPRPSVSTQPMRARLKAAALILRFGRRRRSQCRGSPAAGCVPR